ncbi:MAG: DUF5687 family protein [Prevotellaceae bacterium]|jgi:hypothetical protein|nr:DUF5687 family protein [Prevotellaceae bacterium]
MIVQHLLRQEWLKTARSKAFYKNLAVNIVVALMAVYFAAIFLILGFQLGRVLEEFHAKTGMNPTELINSVMIYIILGGILFRLFMQQLGTINLFTYQMLPVKRSTIVNFLLLKPLASPLNYLTLLIVIPFAITSVSEYYGGAGAFRFVLNAVFIIWFNSLFTAFLKRRFTSVFTSFILIIAVIAGIIALEVFNVFSLSGISGSVFGFLFQHVWGSALLLLFPVLAFVLNRRFFARNYYPEYFNRKNKNSGVDTKTINLSFLDRFGSIGDFMALELKLILRHKRTRSMLYMSALFLFYGLIFYTNGVYGNREGFLFFIAIFVTGFLMFMYGQWIISWDSAYFDGLMTKNIPIPHYIKANYNLLVAFNVICFILTTPYFFFGIRIIQMQIAAFLFNVGINTAILLFFASYNTKRIDLSQGTAFNYQGTTFKNFLILLPLMIIPMTVTGVLSFFMETSVIMAILAGIGLLGIVFRKQMLTLCVNQFNKRKYVLAQGFRDSE